MAVSHGMDVGEVRQLGGSLQKSAGSIDDLIGRIESAVSGSTWVGLDAARFKEQWWPEHRGHLTKMRDDLHGLGQSAINNASDQVQVSGGDSTRGPGDAGVNGSGGEKASVEDSSGSPPNADSSAVHNGDAGGSRGVLSPPRSDEEVIAAYRANPPKGYEPGTNFAWQCTSWIPFRWRELGYTGPIGGGDGWEVAESNGGSADTPPTLGAIASYGSAAKGDDNHVMIVEEVTTTSTGALKIRVSEMNAEDMSVVKPWEYRDDHTFTQQPDGSWTPEGRANVGEIRFAGFPGAS